jgi:AcrR family transcriptional regulator
MTAKQKKLLDTGLKLFQEKGFKAVTVEEICRKAEVSKMTFYKYYRNKVHFVLELMRRLYNGAIAEGKALLNNPKSHRERIADFLEWKVSMLDLFTPAMLLDIKDFDPSLESFMKEKFTETLPLFTDFIKDGQTKGVFRKDMNMPFLVHIFNILSDSFFTENLEQYFSSYEDYVREYLDFLFYGLTERESR